MNPSIVLEFHEKRCVKCDLSKKHLGKLPKAKTTSYGVEFLSFRYSFLWNTPADSIRQELKLSRFKNKMKSWTGEQYTCRICQ